MAVDQTDGEPPSLGSTILVNIGWTANSSSAETNSTAANSPATKRRVRTVRGQGRGPRVEECS